MYLPALDAGSSRSVELALRGEIPTEARAPGADVFDYYYPENLDVAAPISLTVLPLIAPATARETAAMPQAQTLPYEEFRLDEPPPERQWEGPG